MSDKRQFAIVMLMCAGFVVWILYGSLRVFQINQVLNDDPALSKYPYHFRVMRAADDTAVMGTLHTSYHSLHGALRLMFPQLDSLGESSLRMRRAEKEYARMQARAQALVLQHGDWEQIRWQLDENWLRLLRKQRGLPPALNE